MHVLLQETQLSATCEGMNPSLEVVQDRLSFHRKLMSVAVLLNLFILVMVALVICLGGALGAVGAFMCLCCLCYLYRLCQKDLPGIARSFVRIFVVRTSVLLHAHYLISEAS